MLSIQELWQGIISIGYYYLAGNERGGGYDIYISGVSE